VYFPLLVSEQCHWSHNMFHVSLQSVMTTAIATAHFIRFTFVTETRFYLRVFRSTQRSSDQSHVLVHFTTRSWTNCIKPWIEFLVR
jgi:hypothetical protein